MLPVLRIIGGSVLVAVGLAGLVLPILQGWLFLIFGLLLLSKDVPFIRKVLRRLETRFPKITRIRSRVKEWLIRRG
jgi:uncharacterized membrane protein YbaN (DUF454 family)